MFLSRYLDIYEAIENPTENLLEDSEEFSRTDIITLTNLRLPS